MIPYLLLADLQNTVLAAILTLSDRVIYPAYATMARGGTISALEDQSMAGVIMWVPGSLVFLIAAVWLAMEALASPGQPTPQGTTRSRPRDLDGSEHEAAVVCG
jgi:cytochrome c oxidase assembly factor CtaG